ncbi:AMP-binding protein, partial [Acinetobacter baumannii]
VILGTPQGYRGDDVVKRYWEIVERHRIHFFSGVPTLYASLLQVPINGHRVDSLEFGLCGAAPMPVEVFRQFQERTGLKIL